MKLVIWKFDLSDALVGWETKMPVLAKPIHVGLDPRGIPSLWAVCDPDAEQVTRKVVLAPTGGEVPHGTHIGTFVAGRLVLHAFDQGAA